ncbi:MAG TPA: alanine racemase [Thiothrix sp.]|nr:alanine racemase [Thiothrix sp.]
MKRSAWVEINHQALQHNLQRVRELAPNALVMAVVKANAYGHDVLAVAETLSSANGFAVSCLNEALELRQAGFIHPILVMQGPQNLYDISDAASNKLRLVLHDYAHLTLLDQCPRHIKVDVALKLDTGMHRLGFPIQQARELYKRLEEHHNVASNSWLMTHLACADDLQNDYTTQQLSTLKQYTLGIKAIRTIANSAGIIGWKKSHANWVRPGIMLYGASPLLKGDHQREGLKAVMSLYAPIIALHHLKQGDLIGYSSRFRCDKDGWFAVVACGYADGYPRHAPSGTPVWVNGKTAPLAGRVSMDMIVIDVNHIEVNVGDIVELWGEHLSVNRIAEAADTISYELLCSAGNACTHQHNY